MNAGRPQTTSARLQAARDYLASVQAHREEARKAGAWDRVDYLQNSIDSVREEISALEAQLSQERAK